MSQQSGNQANKLLLVLVIALIFSVMNGTMFNVALPLLGKEFSLLPSQASWVMTAYLMLYAIGTVIFGKLADRFKLKNLLTFGLLVFAAGSIFGSFATQFWMVVGGRVLQAAGASVMPAVSMIIPIRYFPIERRGRALGTTAIGLALGSALGPVVAGVITNISSWRMLFLFSILSLVTLPFFRKYLNDPKGEPIQFDYAGALLLGGTVAFLLLGITQSEPWYFIASGIMFILFVVRIKHSSHPFINPTLFANRNYTTGLFLAFLATSINFGLSFIAPQFLTELNQLNPGNIGFVLFPAAFCAAMLGRVGGKLADDRGNFFLMRIASMSLLICFVLLSIFTGASPYFIAFILIFGNVGLTFMQVTMSNTISRTLNRDQVGVGMGLFSMLTFISGAISMSVIGKILDKGQASFQLMPYVRHSTSLIYSNIFVVMGIAVIVCIVVYTMRFGSKQPKENKVPQM